MSTFVWVIINCECIVLCGTFCVAVETCELLVIVMHIETHYEILNFDIFSNFVKFLKKFKAFFLIFSEINKSHYKL